MLWLTLFLATVAGASPETTPPPRPSVVLITMDTTRADAVGVWGSPDARTPTLDRLAALGVRYETAISPAPLTLPAHATILTGLDPPEHGVRSNGNEKLSASATTMASIFNEAGWTTAAFIASRVLDHRFGLDRGFSTYDDAMVAERVGEYGYPERDATAVTDAAIRWLEGHDRRSPFFLWIHYYDPHAPYSPATGSGGGGRRAAYLAEVRMVDGEIRRLLQALPGNLTDTLVAVAGDHGEALGDHGERTHGIFLYRSVLEVPLILAGPGIPAGALVDRPVALRQLAPTLVRLAGLGTARPGSWVELPIPGASSVPVPPVIYAEATMPETSYGWAPLRALQQGGLKYISAPRPELYDIAADPTESRNLIDERPKDVLRFVRHLEELTAEWAEAPLAPASGIDPETRAALERLGYLEGGSSNDGIDPKDGIALLTEVEDASAELRAGRADAAAETLGALAGRNPSNTRLLTRYGQALLASGDGDHAIEAYRRVVELSPQSEFARRNLGDALASMGRVEEARATYRAAIEISPRWAPPWLRLADLAPETEREAILREAIDTGVDSVAVSWRLAELTLVDDADAALDICEDIGQLDPLAAEGALCLGRVWVALGDPLKAGSHLRRATVLGRGTEIGAEAERELESLKAESLE